MLILSFLGFRLPPRTFGPLKVPVARNPRELMGPEGGTPEGFYLRFYKRFYKAFYSGF